MKALIIASISAVLAGSGLAVAQTPTSTPAQATTPAQADQAATTAPLKLQLPDPDPQIQMQPPAGGADSPGVYYGDHSGDGSDNSMQVHGSFTTGIGYSKGYGTSTMNAAELHISKQYDDGKTFDMQINVEQSKGPGFSPYGYGGYYGPRYRGY